MTIITVNNDGSKDFMMVEEAITIASPGDQIIIESGTYIISKPISIPVSNLVISGSVSSIIDGRYLDLDESIFKLDEGVSNIVIENIIFENIIEKKYGEKKAAIYVGKNCSNISIKSNTFSNVFGGVIIYDSKSLMIHGNEFKNGKNGFGIMMLGSSRLGEVGNCYDIIIDSNKIIDYNYYGIQILNPYGSSRIVNNTFVSCRKSGIHSDHNLGSNIIGDGNMFTNIKYDVFIENKFNQDENIIGTSYVDAMKVYVPNSTLIGGLGDNYMILDEYYSENFNIIRQIEQTLVIDKRDGLGTTICRNIKYIVFRDITINNFELPYTIMVDQNGYGDFKTIQEAIDFTTGNQIIKVNYGLYKENISIDKNGVKLYGDYGNKKGSGIESPIINGSYDYGACITLSENVQDVSIMGFVFVNSKSSSLGSNGIVCYGSGTKNINISYNTFDGIGFNVISILDDKYGPHFVWNITNNIIRNVSVGNEVTDLDNSYIIDMMNMNDLCISDNEITLNENTTSAYSCISVKFFTENNPMKFSNIRITDNIITMKSLPYHSAILVGGTSKNICEVDSLLIRGNKIYGSSKILTNILVVKDDNTEYNNCVVEYNISKCGLIKVPNNITCNDNVTSVDNSVMGIEEGDYHIQGDYDNIIYFGPMSNYSLSRNNTNIITVKKQRGIDRIYNVKTIQFEDVMLYIDEIPYTRIVNKNMTDDNQYITIQSAIDDANDGDIILINPGIYNELVTINKNGIWLKGTHSDERGCTPTSPVLDGIGLHGNAITISKGSNRIRVTGLKIRNYREMGIDPNSPDEYKNEKFEKEIPRSYFAVCSNSIDGLIIEHCTIENMGNGLALINSREPSSNIIIRNNILSSYGLYYKTFNRSIPISVHRYGIGIRNGSNLTIENNYFGSTMNNMQKSAISISYCSTEHRSVDIINNEIMCYNNYSIAEIHCDLNECSTISLLNISNNIVRNCIHRTLWVYGGKLGTYERCIIENNDFGNGYIKISTKSDDGFIMENNIFSKIIQTDECWRSACCQNSVEVFYRINEMEIERIDDNSPISLFKDDVEIIIQNDVTEIKFIDGSIETFKIQKTKLIDIPTFVEVNSKIDLKISRPLLVEKLKSDFNDWNNVCVIYKIGKQREYIMVSNDRFMKGSFIAKNSGVYMIDKVMIQIKSGEVLNIPRTDLAVHEWDINVVAE